MASVIQLPPLTFDEGGFRISVFAKDPTRNSVNIIASSHRRTLESRPAVVPEADNEDAEAMQEAQQNHPGPVIPEHPISSMQDAFAESLLESTRGDTGKPKLREFDVKKRHERLLEQGKDDQPHDMKWRYRPNQKQHEVLKLVSQIAFGVYLLLNGMANDNAQVVSILQGHIDEVDEFLEVTLEDLSHTVADLNHRIDQLKLPMSNAKAFEELLEDRAYRNELLQGNEVLEHLCSRVNTMVKQWDDDVDAGLECTTSFTEWLVTLKDGAWRKEGDDLEDIYNAMRGNGEGWLNAFDEMNARVQEINNLVLELMGLTSEMEKKAGEVSRKTWSTIPPFTSPIAPSTGSPKDSSSISSPPSTRSNTRSIKQPSVKSGSTSTLRANLVGDDEDDEDDIDFDDGLSNFPLPSAVPILPPITVISTTGIKRNRIESLPIIMDSDPKFIVINGKDRDQSSKPSTPAPAPTPAPVPAKAPEPESENNDGDALFILQPRTYTPQPPEPLPSPMVRDCPSSPDDGSSTDSGSPLQFGMPFMKGPHESVRESAPALAIAHEEDTLHDLPQANRNKQGAFAAVRTVNVPGPGSSASEAEAFRRQYLARVGSHNDLHRAHMLQINTSNHQQQFHPVLASPYSPLQQRPHTATGPGPMPLNGMRRPSESLPPPARPIQSRGGAMSTMSAAPGTYGAPGKYPAASTRTVAQSSRTMTGQSLKKKKSAFGWLKKAFTMDDDERAAFEARRNMQHGDNYYKDKDPKFLDGKRMR